MKLNAQTNIGLKISSDSLINIGREKLVSITIRIDNSTDGDFEGQIVPVLPKGFSLLSDQALRVKVAGKSHVFYPFKFLVLNNAVASINEMSFQLLNLSGTSVSKSKSQIKIAPIRSTELIVLNPSILLKQVGDSLIVNVMVRNSGNQIEDLKLVAAFPAENGGKSILEKNLHLTPGTEQSLTFSKIINRELYQVNNFYINIAGLYKNGDLFGNAVAYVQNAAASRQFVNSETQQNILNHGLSNQLSLSGQNLFSDSQSWQLNGTGATQLGKGMLGFSVDAYQWNSLNNKPLISNTWVNYENDKKGLTIGNISESLESFVNGRGVKLYSRTDADQHGIETALVQKSYNLLGDNLDYGYMAYLKTNLKDTSGHQYTNTLIFDYAPLEQSRSLLSNNSVGLFNSRHIVMNVNVGGGLSQSLINPEDIKPSFSLGTNLSGVWKKVNFSSSNFFSTAYYPGIRRGVLQLNERISRYIGKQNFWLGYSRYSYNPLYQQTLFLFQRDYMLQRFEAGWAIPVKTNFNLTLTASRDQERAQYGGALGNVNELVAYRLNESVNWHSQNFKQNVFLSLDNGFIKGINGQPKLQLRLNATWSNSWMSLNTYLQKGSFFLAESYNSTLSDEEIYRYSISPSFHQYFFNRKLRAEAGLIFYRDALYGNNTTYMAKADYLITPKTSFYVSSFQYEYRTSLANSSFRSIQAGISQKLPEPKQHAAGKKGNIEILFYKDNNQNGVYDEGDEVAVTGNVLINNIIFIIPANGTIQYNKVPYGNYRLSMPLQNGYEIMPVQILVSQKNVKLQVAMQKSGNVSGKISIIYDENRSQEITQTLSGFNIFLKAKDGAVRNVKTGAEGEYSIYLPEGTYQVFPDLAHLPEHIYFDGAYPEITVKAGIGITIPTLTFKVKEKKIEIKRYKN